MAVADQYLPLMPPDLDAIARPDAVIVLGKLRHRLAIARAARLELGQAFAIQTMLSELLDHEARPVAADLGPDDMGGQELAGRHPQRRPGLRHQPGGQAEVIGMEMGDDEALHRAVQAFDQAAPDGAHAVVGETGIDDRPAVAIAQQPEVDVVELEGQGHAQPENAGRNLDFFAGSRRLGVGIMQGHGQTLDSRRTTYHTVAD